MTNNEDCIHLRQIAGERLGTTEIIWDHEVTPEILDHLQHVLVGSQRPVGGWYPADVLRALSP